MWEYNTIKAYDLDGLRYELERNADWEMVLVTENRILHDPKQTDKMWWSIFEALLKRRKPECTK